MISREEQPINQSASSGALEAYLAQEDDEPGDAVTNNSGRTTTSGSGPGLDEVPRLGELKRPMSRKKVPSASAAAGLGACAFGVGKVTDAFEQRKTRQPIPVESWGPRPPSRTSTRRLPPNTTLLDLSLLTQPGDEDRGEPKLHAATGASRSRSEGGVTRESASGRPSSGTKWAAARYP